MPMPLSLPGILQPTARQVHFLDQDEIFSRIPPYHQATSISPAQNQWVHLSLLNMSSVIAKGRTWKWYGGCWKHISVLPNVFRDAMSPQPYNRPSNLVRKRRTMDKCIRQVRQSIWKIHEFFSPFYYSLQVLGPGFCSLRSCVHDILSSQKHKLGAVGRHQHMPPSAEKLEQILFEWLACVWQTTLILLLAPSDIFFGWSIIWHSDDQDLDGRAY